MEEEVPVDFPGRANWLFVGRAVAGEEERQGVFQAVRTVGPRLSLRAAWGVLGQVTKCLATPGFRCVFGGDRGRGGQAPRK